MRRVLFLTDYTPQAERAYGLAATVADRLGAELTVLHVALPLAVERRVREPAEARRPGATPEGARILEVHELGESVCSAVVGYAERTGPDLIVMGTHGYRGLRHLLNGSVAEEIVRRAPCPVLTLREHARGPYGLRRFLVALDLADGTLAALHHTALLADAFGARVDLLHVVGAAELPAPNALGLGWPGADPGIADRRRVSLASLAELYLPPSLRGEALVEVGSAASLILDVIDRRGADLVVMGTHGRTGLRRLALGSVAEHVLRRAPCPVLTVAAREQPSAPAEGVAQGRAGS